jgi:hypothetical protein
MKLIQQTHAVAKYQLIDVMNAQKLTYSLGKVRRDSARGADKSLARPPRRLWIKFTS